MKFIGGLKTYEDIYIVDPEVDPSAPRWRVYFDDDSIAEMVEKTKNAILNAQHIAEEMDRATDKKEIDSLTNDCVKLQKRVISAFIGTQGYQDILLYISHNDEPADPAKNLEVIGEYFAFFLELLWERASAKGLRKVADTFGEENKRKQTPKRPKKKR